MEHKQRIVLHNIQAHDAGRYNCHMEFPDGRSATSYVDVVLKREYQVRPRRYSYPRRWRSIF